MTREEAISQLKLTSWAQRDQGNHYLADALDMAINALEQEPCHDAISRQAVLAIVNNPLNIRLDEIIKKLPRVNAQKAALGYVKRQIEEEWIACIDDEKDDCAKGLRIAANYIDRYLAEMESNEGSKE